MKTNLSQDFPGTGKVFLELRKEVLPGDEVECEACGKKHLTHFWKFGIVTVEKRARIVCDDCHTALTK